jgi:hypothetical protein
MPTSFITDVVRHLFDPPASELPVPPQ